MNEYDVLRWLDEEEKKRTAAVRAMLIEDGRPDLVEDLNRRIRDIALGLDGARSTWSALSRPQKDILTLLVDRGQYLRRAKDSLNRFVAMGDPHGFVIGGIHAGTVRNLMARDLAEWTTGEKVVATERGRFVWKRGPSIPKEPE